MPSMRTSSSPMGSTAPRRRRGGWLAAVGATSLLAWACVVGLTPADAPPHHRTEPVAGADAPLGAESCDVCHGHSVRPALHPDCESCHGSGQVHVLNPLDLKGIRFPGNADCTDCHARDPVTHAAWGNSAHDAAGLLCTDCHSAHGDAIDLLRPPSALEQSLLRHASDASRLCASCHTEVATRFDLPSHHPVREGMLDCTSCHATHQAEALSFGGRSGACTGCHQDHVGPWIYEHAPVAEDCGYCHEAHGSAAYDLLETNEPGVCISCHSVPMMGATHSPEAFVTRCTDCHGSIHGSFSDPHLRR